ncbi:hypothetical protein KSF73_00600 [Burkholderiaceae bacterium DAT-1]|nr:hypothetical protein [Burkholderiaceae bacterium DAT-1]
MSATAPFPLESIPRRVWLTLALSVIVHGLLLAYVRWTPTVQIGKETSFDVTLDKRAAPDEAVQVPVHEVARIVRQVETTISSHPVKRASQPAHLSQPVQNAPPENSPGDSVRQETAPNVRLFTIKDPFAQPASPVGGEAPQKDFHAGMRNRARLPSQPEALPEPESRKKLAADIQEVFGTIDSEVRTLKMQNGQVLAVTKTGNKTSCVVIENNHPFGLGPRPQTMVTCPDSGLFKHLFK